MDIKVIITFSFSILYGLFEFLMSRMVRGNREVTETDDKGSIWYLMLSISAGYFLSFIIASSETGRIYQWNTFFIIGVLLIIPGLIIRVSSILKLKHQFTYKIARIEKQELIRTGLYKYIRHPGYLGQLIIFLGIATSLSNWLSIVLMMVPVLAGFLNRIRIEENFLVKQLGRDYIDYQNHTKKLIPFLF